jgi:hypothetical protein
MSILQNFAQWVLKDELAALETRLSEASTALDTIEQKVVAIAPTAVADVHALGEDILQTVLASADKLRLTDAPAVNTWEQKLRALYTDAKSWVEAHGGVVLNDAEKAVAAAKAKAEALLAATVQFFKKK